MSNLHQPPPMPPQAANTGLFQSNLDVSNSYSLRTAAVWAKVVGIGGLILGFLFILSAFLTSSVYGMSEDQETTRSSFTINMYLIFGIPGLVFLISSIFALVFGNKISRALASHDNVSLQSGLSGLKNYFVFWGILTLVCLLVLAISVAAGLMA